MKIIITEECHIDEILNIYEPAKLSLKELGLDQWQNGYPNLDSLLNDIKNNESYNLELSFKMDSGKINVLVTNTDMDNKVILSENNITTNSLSVPITEPGTYRVYFEVKDFTGYYSYDFIKN